MKKLLSVLIVACLIFSINCTKVDNKEHPVCCVLPQPAAFIFAQKNGVSWSAIAYNAAIVQDSLKITGHMDDTEVLGITIKYNGTGQYTLTGNQVYYHNTTSPMVALVNLSNYTLDNTAANTLSISNYDSSANTVSGTFSIVLTKTYGAPNTGFPQNINFLNGNFKLPLAK
ncbi:hypothetical protein BEL04_21425 [Mucilaginibacter sp. PPCGB 2223]|uniref:DUF6252 family protein n=1 Tax=Mucilaginibacter sp. PPCGB 2223 TaxID=1886027 RepID=UPI000824274A|nr:DUF6252 family protein [Mucilaginibacter sp. PPCGB 2223]OCX50351.1 hypothetical protein BEL04_21425 [Mucilaginibacter sp. PPCGB 2223]